MTFAGLLPAFYRRQGLPEHGGQEGWVDWASVFGVPLPIPNPPARKRVLPYHDAHHMITGYGTDWRGEAEVSAWSFGARGPSTWLALAYDGLGLSLGVLAPVRTSRAYLRGRGCRSLYRLDREVLLGSTLEELRAASGVDEPRATTPLDRVALVVVCGATVLTAPLVFAPLFLLGALTE